jgi:hypothetical protein
MTIERLFSTKRNHRVGELKLSARSTLLASQQIEDFRLKNIGSWRASQPFGRSKTISRDSITSTTPYMCSRSCGTSSTALTFARVSSLRCLFQLDLPIKTVLNNMFATGHKNEMLDTGFARLVNDVLNRRPVDDR